jgi:peptide/nickel transport system ATP-binding protein
MLQVRNLTVSFRRYAGPILRRTIPVLDGVDVDVGRGELVAVVGESGAGKSILAHAIFGILPTNARVEGNFVFEGEVLDESRRRALCGRRMALVPQGVTWLDPTATAGRQVRWGAEAAGRKIDAAAVGAELSSYGLEQRTTGLYPHELSGGMARRVATAIATISGADLLVADEPTAGLDPEIRDVALALLRQNADAGKAVLVVTHDLAAIAAYADRIAVMHGGHTVEIAAADRFRDGTMAHPYSRALWAALPDGGFEAPAAPTGGRPRNRIGCSYALECDRAVARCHEVAPGWTEMSSDRVRCHDARSA